MQILPTQGQSLIDHLHAISVKDADHGLLMWYDFFKEQLYYSFLREKADPQQVVKAEVKSRQRWRGNLYEKKKAMSRKHWGEN
jgi:hypothetical protein